MTDITPDDVRDELVRQGRDPGEFSDIDIEQLARTATDLSQLMVGLTPLIASLADYVRDVFAPAMLQLAACIEEWAGWMPGPQFRRARKRRHLAEHYARKAARVPAWKR